MEKLVQFLLKLKQPRVIALIVMLILQAGARFGYQWDSVVVQDNAQMAIDALTALSGVWVAVKSEKGSII